MSYEVKLAYEKGRQLAKEELERKLREALERRKVEVGWKETPIKPELRKPKA